METFSALMAPFDGNPLMTGAERHQAIIWTNVGSLLIEPFEIKFSQILIAIHGRKQGPGGDSFSNALVENRQFFLQNMSFSLNDR